MEQTLIERLRIRAEIRRNIKTRESVKNGEPDRIADLLEEAADEIERLNRDAERYRKLTFIYADNPNVALYHKGTLHVPYLYINEFTREAFDKALDKVTKGDSN